METFQQRAIQDTLWTVESIFIGSFLIVFFQVESMEKERTEYRGALAWMKVLILEISKKLFIILACLDEERQHGA